MSAVLHRVRIAIVMVVGALIMALPGTAPASATTTYVYYQKYPWAADVFRVTQTVAPNRFDSWTVMHITYAEWLSYGSPQWQTVYRIHGDFAMTYPSNRYEIFMQFPSDVRDPYGIRRHHLSWDEYVAAGRPSFWQADSRGFYKSASNSTVYVVYPCSSHTAKTAVSYQDWEQLGFPTPVIGPVPSCW